MKKLMIEISDTDFAWLEVLAHGVTTEECENMSKEEKKKRMDEIVTPEEDDFTPGVKELIDTAIGVMAAGMRRPGSWEGHVIRSMLNYDGTYNPLMFAESIQQDAKSLGFIVRDMKTGELLK